LYNNLRCKKKMYMLHVLFHFYYPFLYLITYFNYMCVTNFAIITYFNHMCCVRITNFAKEITTYICPYSCIWDPLIKKPNKQINGIIKFRKSDIWTLNFIVKFFFYKKNQKYIKKEVKEVSIKYKMSYKRRWILKQKWLISTI
jgi:hypothetical protein